MKKHRLYKKHGDRAKTSKVRLQMAIGIGLTILVGAKLACWLDWFEISWLKAFGQHFLHTDKLLWMGTLEIVARALAYSSAVELAYTLFTEGPDEAVEPVIMGLAAAMLLGISTIDKIDLASIGGVVLYVIALAGLFAIRQYFIKPEMSDDQDA
jgi:hypothetical protein